MRIHELEIKDLGPHKHIHVTDIKNILGIIAPNGSGKSIVMACIKALLTGQWDRPGAKYVRNYAADSDDKPTNGWARMRVTIAGKELELFRQEGKTSKVWMTSPDFEQPVKSVAEISKYLSGLYGADLNSVCEAVFIDQGDLGRLFSDTAAVRFDQFLKMMNLNYLLTRVNHLNGEIQHLSKGLVDLGSADDELDTVRRNADEVVVQNRLTLQTAPRREKLLTVLRQYMASYDRLNQPGDHVADVPITQAPNRLETDKQALLQELQTLLGEYSRQRVEEICETLEKQKQELQTSVDGYQEKIDSYDYLVQLHDELSKSSATLLVLQNIQTETTTRLQEAASFLESLCHADDEVQTKFSNYTELLSFFRSAEDVAVRVNSYLEEIENKTVVEKETKDRLADLERKIEEVKLRKHDYHSDMIRFETELGQLSRWETVMRNAVEHQQCPADESGKCLQCGLRLDIDNAATAQDLEDLITKIDVVKAKQTAALLEQSKLVPVIRELEEGISVCNRFFQELQTKKDLLSREKVSFAKKVFKRVDEVRSCCQTIERGRLELDNLKKQITQTSETSSRLLEKAKPLPETPPTEENLIDLQKQLDSVKTSLHGWSTHCSRIAVVEGKIQTTETKLAEATAALSRLQMVASVGIEAINSCRQEMDPSESNTWVKFCQSNSRNSLTELEVLFGEKEANYNALRGQMTESERQAENIEKQWRELQSRKLDQERKLQLINLLRDARSVIIKDGAPTTYLQTKFELMNDIVNKQLENLEAKFVVRPAENTVCAFEFLRKDHEVQQWFPQDTLSGGEKVRLAIAFLMATQSVMVPHVGLLFLDEPSVHQDTQGMLALRSYLQNMGLQIEGNDYQICLVDHAEEVAEVARTRIRL